MSNETKVEVIGDASIKYELVNNEWMVSSLEIHRVFKAGMTTNHGTMINDMKSRSEGMWNKFIGGKDILTSSWTNSNNKSHDFYYLNNTASRFYIFSMTGRKADDFKIAFINKFDELEKFVTRVATGEKDLSPEACEVLNGIASSHNVMEMGDFAKVMMLHNQGANIGRNNLYKLLRCMELISKTTNRHLNKGDEYFDTKIDVRSNTYVVVRTQSLPKLINLIFEYTAKHSDTFPEFKRKQYTGELKDYLEEDDNPIFVADEVERTFYNKHGVYEQMLSAKEDMVEMVMSDLHRTNFVGEYTLDLNGNFVDDGFKGATFNKPTLTISRDKHGNTMTIEN